MLVRFHKRYFEGLRCRALENVALSRAQSIKDPSRGFVADDDYMNLVDIEGCSCVLDVCHSESVGWRTFRIN